FSGIHSSTCVQHMRPCHYAPLSFGRMGKKYAVTTSYELQAFFYFFFCPLVYLQARINLTVVNFCAPVNQCHFVTLPYILSPTNL
ncbi:unnamed protein product, partial [Heterotrigona itama]